MVLDDENLLFYVLMHGLFSLVGTDLVCFVQRRERFKSSISGRTKSTASDQKFVNRNESLRISCRMGYPVRVLRCDNEPAPWTWYVIMNSQHLRSNIAVPAQLTFAKSFCSDVHGDHPRPLPDIKELKNATDITERKESPSWDYDEDKECWIWKKHAPSKIRVKKQACEEKLTRKRKTSNNAENVVDDGAVRNK
ncbi:hypothetical protein ACLB2K_004540 [Fragaria x ananassa]